MTVSTELSHEEYTGNGVTTDFDFRFRIFEAKHLVVSVADPDGTERILTNGTDYTLRGVGSYRGGKVILKMPLATGWKIGIARDLPAVQETDLRNQGKFFAEVHEDAFDYLTMLIQKSLGFLSLCLRKPSFISDHYDAKGNKISNLGKPVKNGDAVDLGTMKEHISAKDKRSLRVADKDIPVLPNVANRANKLLSFDDNGNPVVIVPESGSAADVLIELAKPGGAELIGTDSGGTVQAEINDLREDAKSTKRISAPCISFIFDDGKMSHVTVVAPLFRSYNLRCGFAINTEGLGLTDNMQGADVISLSGDGFEIISHSYSAVNLGSQVNDTFVMAELSTAQSMFYEMGISPSIFQAPSSVVADEHMHIVDGFYSYAFTRSPSPLPMKNEHPTRLRRFGLETATGIISLDEAKSVVDDAVSKNGVIVFYAHDVPDGSDKKKLISDIIDYAITEGVSIVPPSSAVFSASKSQNLPSKMITMGDTILNELNGWVATNGTVQVTANKDIVVTASSPGSCLIQLPVGMKLTDNRGITFSAAFRNLRGSVSSASIGANIYSGSSVIRSVEKPITGLDAVYRRYSVSHVMPFNADRILSFFRVNFSATGDQVLIRAPVVRYGTSVNPDTHWKSFYDVDIVGGQTIPNSSSSYSRIKLTDSSSNGLFSVSENKISFDRPCTVSLAVSILANGANLAGNTGGVLRVSVGSATFNIPSSSGTNNAGASQSMTINVTTQGNVAFDMINTGSQFTINNLSSISIQEV